MTEIHLKRCIYRVPGWLKNQVCDGNDRTPYEPEIVSFGPYHRGEEGVQEMEEHKRRCLSTMLDRKTQRIDEYLEGMRGIEKDVRDCYQGWYKFIDSEAFMKMLVLDGCFMLEFLRVHEVGLVKLGYKNDDPVFSKRTIMHVIARDMMKLENQLPLIVLEKLVSLYYKPTIKDKKYIPEIVMRALTPIWITNQILSENYLITMRTAVAADPNNKEMLHCLDIFRSSLLYKPPDGQVGVQVEHCEDQVPIHVEPRAPAAGHCLNMFLSRLLYKTPERREEVQMADIANTSQEEQPDPETGGTPASASPSRVPNERPGYWSSDDGQGVDVTADENKKQPSDAEMRANSVLMVYCVQDLREAGVKFKTRNCQPFWDIKFDKHRGLLEIPPIKIDDASKTVFLNLIAYEQCHLRKFREMSITDYVAFMDNLLNSASDVGHLHQAGIIAHQLGSDKEVAELFNRLVKKAFVSWKDGRLSELYKDLNRYCTYKRHRWCATGRMKYWNDPCVIASLVIGFILFSSSLVQTFYTIFPYYKPRKN